MIINLFPLQIIHYKEIPKTYLFDIKRIIFETVRYIAFMKQTSAKRNLLNLV
jgi:hypothetical protein